ncbi:hypothetical protein CHELA17_63453 [Chelatococcus asaccharovorans]|nr:hypothetical protein CHELA17_63453 [Chelatococcus asaccharovorans]
MSVGATQGRLVLAVPPERLCRQKKGEGRGCLRCRPAAAGMRALFPMNLYLAAILR